MLQVTDIPEALRVKLIPALQDFTAGAMEVIKTANDERDAAVRARQAAEQEVQLVKVAATQRRDAGPFQFSDTDISETVAELVDAGLYPAGHSVKLAEDMKRDPAFSLQILKKIASLSAQPRTAGTGVRRDASTFDRGEGAVASAGERVSREEAAAVQSIQGGR